MQIEKQNERKETTQYSKLLIWDVGQSFDTDLIMIKPLSKVK
jgi:hypothetical protein